MSSSNSPSSNLPSSSDPASSSSAASNSPRPSLYADTSKRRILICGYPKSGNTWLTRLVAELVGCPVSGLWMCTKNTTDNKGQTRISEYECFKAHHD